MVVVEGGLGFRFHLNENLIRTLKLGLKREDLGAMNCKD